MLKLKRKHRNKIKHGTRLVTLMFESTGLPHGYSMGVAWFAERMVLASLVLIVLSFAAGVMFVLRLSEPIGNSHLYDSAAAKARLAEDGIKVFSQQVIDIASPVFAQFIKDNHSEEEIAAEQMAIRKEKLKQYFADKKSPFAEDDQALESFASSKNMKMMVAISFVESTYGKNCYYYNCSGIGGTPPNLRKYDNYSEWIHDFDKLLEDRYKDVPPEKFIGLYVQPGSPNWIHGVNQVLGELKERNVDAKVRQ